MKFNVGVIAIIGFLTIVIIISIFNQTEVASITVDNSVYSMKYLIKDGIVRAAKINLENKALIISIEPISDGELTAIIPRTMIDAKIGSADDRFFVIVDGEEVNYEEKSTGQYRTLIIPFIKGNQEIEIIGSRTI